MQVSIDRAGRVVVPKRVRDELGFSPDRPLEAEVVDGRLELSVPHAPAKIVPGPNGPVVAATGTPITDEEMRRALEAVRERR
ncbi:MAG TPA: AbrB/MazE/SpoVT family DNA-binding domain-containing protein [Solirubrobacteraceae bacterium]|jgi:AbrB family looped-hinge helix DNA binding protein|nr:AbrB/MazE/SpoVT family DNA-binding domain-containing protein [Solirubrobacteraceae bacterium]